MTPAMPPLPTKPASGRDRFHALLDRACKRYDKGERPEEKGAGMTAEFSEMGLNFVYPENWEVAREEDSEFPRSVSVHSPTGAFWSVSVDRRDSQAMADEMLDAMRREYETDFEFETMQRNLAGRQLCGYELHFTYVDLVVTACILATSAGGLSYVLLFQAESRDFDQLSPVFDAMSLSLLQERGAEAS